MSKNTPGRRLIAAVKARITRVRIVWLESELRAVEHDVQATTAEIADYEFCGQPHTADGLRAHLRQRNFQAACLRAEIHQLKENLQ